MAGELVVDGWDNVILLSRLLKLPRTKEVCTQDLRRIFLSIEMARYTVRDCRLPGSRIAEDRWTIG